jgi:uncharacterized protein (TIGR03067 family)
MAKRPRGGTAQQSNEARTHPEAFLGHLEDCWDEPPPGPVHGRRSDVDRLQGAWASVNGRRRAAFLVSGNHFALHFAEGDIYMGTFELDGATRPRVMVVRIHEGPHRHKGQTAMCIFEFREDILHWCTSGPGRSAPPAAFAEDDPGFLNLVFQREQRLETRRG